MYYGAYELVFYERFPRLFFVRPLNPYHQYLLSKSRCAGTVLDNYFYIIFGTESFCENITMINSEFEVRTRRLHRVINVVERVHGAFRREKSYHF